MFHSLASVTPPLEMAKVASFSGISGLEEITQGIHWGLLKVQGQKIVFESKNVHLLMNNDKIKYSKY